MLRPVTLSEGKRGGVEQEVTVGTVTLYHFTYLSLSLWLGLGLAGKAASHSPGRVNEAFIPGDPIYCPRGVSVSLPVRK